MSETVETIIIVGRESILEFPNENVAVSLPLTPVGAGLYRIDGVPVFAEGAAFGDIIEAQMVEEGRFRWIRVVQPGGWQTWDFPIPYHKIGLEMSQSLLRQLELQGGHWELLFGGLLLLCIPPGLELDPTPWVELLTE